MVTMMTEVAHGGDISKAYFCDCVTFFEMSVASLVFMYKCSPYVDL